MLGATFCYFKRFWKQHRFPNMNEGADTVFVWNLQNANVWAHQDVQSNASNSAYSVALPVAQSSEASSPEQGARENEDYGWVSWRMAQGPEGYTRRLYSCRQQAEIGTK